MEDAMKIERFMECHFLASLHSRQVLRKVGHCPCDWRESRTRRSLIVNRSVYSHINEEIPEDTTKPHLRSRVGPLQILSSVMIKRLAIKR